MPDADYLGTRAIVDNARKAERERMVAIISRYREQAMVVEPPEERERLLLVLGLLRGEINGK